MTNSRYIATLDTIASKLSGRTAKLEYVDGRLQLTCGDAFVFISIAITPDGDAVAVLTANDDVWVVGNRNTFDFVAHTLDRYGLIIGPVRRKARGRSSREVGRMEKTFKAGETFKAGGLE